MKRLIVSDYSNCRSGLLCWCRYARNCASLVEVSSLCSSVIPQGPGNAKPQLGIPISYEGHVSTPDSAKSFGTARLPTTPEGFEGQASTLTHSKAYLQTCKGIAYNSVIFSPLNHAYLH